MDHFPYNIANALEAAAASYGITTDIGREELEETPLTQSQRSDVQEGTKKCSWAGFVLQEYYRKAFYIFCDGVIQTMPM